MLYQLIGAVGETIGNQITYMLFSLIKSKVNLYSMNRMCKLLYTRWTTLIYYKHYNKRVHVIDSVLKIRWRTWQQLVKVSLCHKAWWLCRSCDEDGFLVFGTFLSLFWWLCFFIGTCLRYFNLHQKFYGLTTAPVLVLGWVLIQLYLGISDLLEQFAIRETFIKITLSFVILFLQSAFVRGHRRAGSDVQFIERTRLDAQKAMNKELQKLIQTGPPGLHEVSLLKGVMCIKGFLVITIRIHFFLGAFCNCKWSKKKIK